MYSDKEIAQKNADRIKAFSPKRAQEFDDYLQKNIGINLDQIPGYQTVLKKNLMVSILVSPENHYSMRYPIKMKAGTKIEIVGFNLIEPLGYSNSLRIIIIDPQVELQDISSRLESLIEAIK